MNNKYRRCVGMMILNDKNEILVGRRLDHPSGYWQMPQGGIDQNEIPKEAVWREMMEEIGTNKALLITSSSNWLNYEIPKETLKKLPWGKEYIGQTQKWFAFRYTGKDSEININTKNPEFSDWKWIELNSLMTNIVPFKKTLYSKVLEEFKDIFKDY
jgi:putative (di)nucleoside polyphosphate hydrolase